MMVSNVSSCGRWGLPLVALALLALVTTEGTALHVRAGCGFEVVPTATTIYDAQHWVQNGKHADNGGPADVMEPLTVCLRAGIHDVSRRTLTFDNYGGRPVTWQGEAGTIVSGGVQVSCL